MAEHKKYIEDDDLALEDSNLSNKQVDIKNELDSKEISDLQDEIRKNANKQIEATEPRVQFYDESNFPKELELPETLKEDEKAIEVYSQAKKLLCGKESDLSQREFDYVKKCVEVIITPSEDNDESNERDKKYESLKNDELTTQVNELVSFGKDGSILEKQRKILGIKNKSEEKLFHISVLQVEDANWEKITNAPDMFCRKNPNGENVIYMSTAKAQYLLGLRKDSGEWEKKGNEKMLQHEYRHTQRSFSVGKNSELFRFIDESTTNVTGYRYLEAFLAFLLKTTDDIEYHDLINSYNSNNKKEMASCLSKIADAIGGLGLLILGGKKSSNCADSSDGIEDLPLNEGNFNNNEWLQFAETIFSLREKNDSSWKEKFKINIQDETKSLKYIEVAYHKFLSLFKNKIEDSDAPFTKDFFEILQSEIERRKKLGEEPFYKDI